MTTLGSPRRALRCSAMWSVALALGAASCGPAITIERFQVTIAMVEHCTAHSAGGETCAEPDPTTSMVPVVIETRDQTAVTLYATEPGDGTDRAYAGTRSGDALALVRESRNESDAGCVYAVSADVNLTIDGDRIDGSERRVSDEAGTCNALGLRTVERLDWSWRGERVPIE